MNLSTGESLYLPNDMAFEWTSDDPDYEIFGGSVFIELTIYNQPDIVVRADLESTDRVVTSGTAALKAAWTGGAE